MAKFAYLIAPLLTGAAVSANAAATNLIVATELTDYSGSSGKRQETSAESTTDFGATAVGVGLTYGTREAAGDTHKSVRLSGSLYHDWSKKFYTRTSVAVSSNKPVFATRELAQDLNYKILSNAVLTVGGKYARYANAREAVSWSAGSTYYFGRGLITYRFSAFDVSRLGKSYSHLATFRLKDTGGKGSTQLWLGAGSALQEQEALFAGSKGKYRTVALQRVQPLGGPISLIAGLNRTWYDLGATKYRSTAATIGFAVSDLPRLFGKR